jgi:tetratricopeptide (TPR) repeat protein
MKITLSVLSLFFAGVFSGCALVGSVQPLYTQAEIQKPYLNQRVEGEWIMANLDDSDEDAATPKRPCRVGISKSSAGEVPYVVEFRCSGDERDPGKDYSKFDFSLVSLGTATFFDARFAESKEKEKHISLGEIAGKGIIPVHLLGQVWVQQDFVRFTLLQSDWVEKSWPGNSLLISEGEKYGKVDVLTNPTPDLRDLFSRNAGSPDAFSAPLFLCRAGADCDSRAMEDQLTRTPNSQDVLAGAVKFYAKRGDLARAISLQRHKIRLDSDAAEDQFTLGQLLLLTRDFDGARNALATAKEPSERPSITELVVRSHFLQGNYAGTVQAAKSLDAPANLISADPIILKYFALNRLGRVKEAESYLRAQAGTFVGPAQEQLYLLEILGRVTDSLLSYEDPGRSTYYYALDRLRNGDVDHCRSHLQDLVKVHPKNDLIGLAAQIELERLPLTTNK